MMLCVNVPQAQPRDLRGSLALSAVLLALVPIGFAVVLVAAGYPPQLGPFVVGALGWMVAFALRMPVILLASRILGTPERGIPVVIAASGPAEEMVRVIAVLLVGRDPLTALWLGLGWTSIEVVYTYVNAIAIAQLAKRTDEEARRARELLPPAMFTSSAPLWGAIERVGASALHIGFTLIVAAVPIAFIVTALIHSAFNLILTSMARSRPIYVVEGFVCGIGGVVLVVGLLMAGVI